MSVNKYDLPVALDGFETTKDVDVSEFIPDARLAIWALYDPVWTEISGAVSIVDAITVRITSDPALAAGSYQLVGLS